MTSKLSRRRFLQSIGLAGSAAAMSGLFPQSLLRVLGQDAPSIRYLFPAGGGPEEEQVYLDVLANFEATTGINVEEVHPTGDVGILELLQIELAAGEAPDVTWNDIGSVAQFAKRGGFIPLDPYVEAENYDFSDFFPQQFVEAGRVDGVLYGLPRELNTLVTFFNKTLFDEAGLEDPYTLWERGEWTWENFIEAGKALTKPEIRQYGTAGYDNHPWMMDMLVRQNGAQMVSDDLTTVTLTDPRAIEAYQYAIDLLWTHQIMPQPGTLEAWAGPQFASQNVATIFAGRWVVPLFSTITDFEWGTAPVPAGPAGSFTPLVGAFHHITKDSTNPDAAWELVKFMSDTWAQERSTELGLLIPVRRSVAYSPTYLEYPGMEPKYNQVFLDAIEEGGRLLPINENWNEYSDIWVEETAEAWLGNEPIADAVQRVQDRVERLFG
jgi:multiple sugar transport system substrate-binding protein